MHVHLAICGKNKCVAIKGRCYIFVTQTIETFDEHNAAGIMTKGPISTLFVLFWSLNESP